MPSTKARWNFWRPITAIREADTDGNPATSADPTWTPLVVNPPYHPSGHLCLSSSIVHTLKRFFKADNVQFGTFSPGSGTTRNFTSYSQVLAEIVDARVNSGIHFRKADVDGALIGEQVAGWVGAHAFRATGRGRGASGR